MRLDRWIRHILGKIPQSLIEKNLRAGKIKLNKKSNLVEFSNRLNNIDLIDNFYVQQLNKDYVLVKIKYLGKINKIINKLKDQNINLKMIAGQWQLTII